MHKLATTRRLAWLIAWLLACQLAAGAALGADSGVDFNRDIRPLLSDRCFKCHGPDPGQRKADLRLDVGSGELSAWERGLIVPGQPEESELLRRVSSSDADERMPPPDEGRPLSAAEQKLLTQWIAAGAAWQRHWSFEPPWSEPPPAAAGQDWARNGIDSFVLARLQREQLSPSPEASRERLIRRVTLDLTGLPPTPEQVARFVEDKSPDAYERLVDRLLASPKYGERMAVPWLNAARYADTSGYQNDGPRYMWRWRDWVIEALNANMPFDQFTVEQIAGDMLPGATLQQKIASGFNRNHRGNAEGGIIPEEFAVEYVVDRVDTTATVWLGLTLACARCHEHKFDPVQQEEFYRFFAYFNNVPEHGRAIKEGNSPPVIKAPTPAQQRRLTELRDRLRQLEEQHAERDQHWREAQASWERQAREASHGEPLEFAPDAGLLAHLPLDSLPPPRDSQTPTSLTFEGPDDGAPIFVAGVRQQAAQLDGSGHFSAGDVGRFGYFDKFSISLWVRPLQETGTLVSRMVDSARADGYYLRLQDGHLQVNLVKRWLDDSIRVQTVRRLKPAQWHHVAATYDGSRVADGIMIYVDGQRQDFDVRLDALNQSFVTDQPLRLGAGGGEEYRFRGELDEVRIYDRDLSPREVAAVACPDSIEQILQTTAERRSRLQQVKIEMCFRRQQGPPEIRQQQHALLQTRRQVRQFEESIPTVMVMQEMETPRPTYVLERGQYDKPGEQVEPGVPECLPPLPPGAPNNRLGLAQWLVDSSNPLTARVTVNRSWALLFGAGLVRTSEDFGAQGERPSHPELLNWLARELVRSGWDMKALHRLIVTSATYRQSSRVSDELLARDPENRLLARGSRFRLPAEVVRDQALAAAGLLVHELGGPSVKPYQPQDLWKDIATDNQYEQDHGRSLYRRSLYTYWKRTVAPPTMVNFDAPTRESCTVRSARTNTPLQALTLLNEVTFVEAARAVAARCMQEAGESPQARLQYAFQLVLSRTPSDRELEVLLAGWRRHLVRYQQQPPAARELTQAGEHAAPEGLDRAELAAYTAVCSVILNLDETVTRE